MTSNFSFFEISFEEMQQLLGILSKYRTAIKRIDEKGRITLGTSFANKYFQYAILKHYKYYLILGLLVEPQDIIKELLKK